MKVFISWSGTLSHQVALALREWLPSVIQSIEPYVSSEDIDKGARWSTDIAAELEKSAYGILCVTRDNLEAPWINFEAGALSKSVDKSRVSPFLFGLKRSDVKAGPLLQFQSTVTESQDVQKLVASLNASCDPPLLEEQRLIAIFNVWWPQLDAKLKQILDSATSEAETAALANQVETGSSEILEEILELARQQNRIINSPQSLLPPSYIRDILLDERDRHPIDRAVVRPGHPVYADLDEEWRNFSSMIHGTPAGESVPTVLVREALKRLSGPIEYILRMSGGRKRPGKEYGRSEADLPNI